MVGALVVYLLNFGVRGLLYIMEKNADWTPPLGLTIDRWKAACQPEAKHQTGTKIYGVLEIEFFYIAFWMKEPLIVAAWLAFKVASKWEAILHSVSVRAPMARSKTQGFYCGRCFLADKDGS